MNRSASSWLRSFTLRVISCLLLVGTSGNLCLMQTSQTSVYAYPSPSVLFGIAVTSLPIVGIYAFFVYLASRGSRGSFYR